jgi:hypothetical protein
LRNAHFDVAIASRVCDCSHGDCVVKREAWKTGAGLPCGAVSGFAWGAIRRHGWSLNDHQSGKEQTLRRENDVGRKDERKRTVLYWSVELPTDYECPFIDLGKVQMRRRSLWHCTLYHSKPKSLPNGQTLCALARLAEDDPR